MTFTSIASKPTHPITGDLISIKSLKVATISIATSVLAIIGVTLFQNLLWMSASYPAELPASQKQAMTTTVK
jgi:hypothetical protein